MERIGRALDSFAWSENEDLGWYTFGIKHFSLTITHLMNNYQGYS